MDHIIIGFYIIVYIPSIELTGYNLYAYINFFHVIVNLMREGSRPALAYHYIPSTYVLGSYAPWS